MASFVSRPIRQKLPFSSGSHFPTVGRWFNQAAWRTPSLFVLYGVKRGASTQLPLNLVPSEFPVKLRFPFQYPKRSTSKIRKQTNIDLASTALGVIIRIGQQLGFLNKLYRRDIRKDFSHDPGRFTRLMASERTVALRRPVSNLGGLGACESRNGDDLLFFPTSELPGRGGLERIAQDGKRNSATSL